MGALAVEQHKASVLYARDPHWRLVFLLRLATAVVSLLAVVSFAVVVSWHTVDGSFLLEWQWGDVGLEGMAFVPVSLMDFLSVAARGLGTFADVWGWGVFAQPVTSVLWAGVTVSCLLVAGGAVHPGADLGVDLGVVLMGVLPLSFVVGVSGPLQWVVDGANPTSGGTYAGVWELVGVIGLAVLEALHFGLFIWACRRTHLRRKEQKVAGEPEWGMSRSHSARDSLASKTVEVQSMEPYAKQEEVEMPIMASASIHKKLYRYGNSWEVVDVSRVGDVDYF